LLVVRAEPDHRPVGSMDIRDAVELKVRPLNNRDLAHTRELAPA
jgi:hypothetical protein